MKTKIESKFVHLNPGKVKMPSLAKDVYLEVSISGKETSELKLKAKHFFKLQGMHPDEIAFYQTRNNFKACIYSRSFKKVEKMEENFSQSVSRGLKWRTKLLEPADWRDKWMLDYHMQNLTSEFILVPAWEKKKWKPSQKMPLFLDPKSAFGSGTHETTRLVIKHMKPFKGKIKSFLDIGIGTGILSVVAHRFGAKMIMGFDHDSESVKVARKNLKDNEFIGAKFSKKDLRTLKLRKKFDLVCANVLSGVLIQNKRKIASFPSKGSFLIVSGILKRNEKTFLKQFQHRSLRCQKVLRGRRWCAVLYKRV